MKKYKVKFYCVDYRECEMEIQAENKLMALQLGAESIDEGKANYDLVKWHTWKKPTATLIRGKN